MGRSRPRRYTDKERADSVAFLIGCGWPENHGALSKASAHLGVPWNTLKGWATESSNPPPEEELEKSVIDLRAAVESEIGKALQHMDTVREEATYRDAGWVVAVMTDKLLLLDGKPTGNVKNTISFERTGITSLPEHLAPGTVEGHRGEEAV